MHWGSPTSATWAPAKRAGIAGTPGSGAAGAPRPADAGGGADAGRGRRAGRRIVGVLGSYLLVVLFLLTLNFVIPRELPGRPIATLWNPNAATFVSDPAKRAALEHYYGLDRPLLSQYGSYLVGLAHGNLGTSINYNRPVLTVIGERLPWTLLLVGTALLLGTALGGLAGVHAGWRRGRAADRWLVSVFLLIDNFPLFFVASAAAYLLAVKVHVFPLNGATTPFSDASGTLQKIGDILDHLALPAGVLALQFTAFQFLVMRAGMVGELGTDYLVLGRAKGLMERTLEYRYAARNALLPAVTVLGLQIGFAVTAAVFVESVFAYPGIGRLMFDAVSNRDYPLIQGCFLILSLIVVAGNLFADLAYRWLDPRVVN